MRKRAVLAAIISLSVPLTLVGSRSARAELGASGTRLSIGGSFARFYMTYGHAEEPELYAPVIPDLARMEVTFQRRGEDYYVFYRGSQKAVWPIVRSREEVPETGEEACVLLLGGNVYVPLKKLTELVPVDLKWDKKENLVSIVPGSERRRPVVAQTPRSQTPPVRPHGSLGPPELRASEPSRVTNNGALELTGVEVEQGPKGVQLRVRSTGRVQPTMFNLKNPARIVLDFPGARWAEGVQAPEGSGEIRKVRIGYFQGTIPRIALDVPSPAVRLSSLQVDQGETVAIVGQGRQMAMNVQPRIAVDPNSTIGAIQRRAQGGSPRGSRGSPIPGLPGRGGLGDPENPGLPFREGSLVGRVICVDAGHGGHSSGARGLDNWEKDITMAMCRQFKQALEARGATVIMTRDGDTFVSLEERCQIANSRNAAIFVSIHLNSTPRRNSASGTETYYYTNGSFPLAQSLHGRVCAVAGKEDRGIRGNRGFFVIKYTRMPSVLLEIAYINNANDEQLLASPDFQARLGESLAEGVTEYFSGGRLSENR